MFRDSRVRRALNYAVDRTTIIDQVFNGHGVPANTPTWPDHWASDHDLPSYTYDPVRGAALLDAAGLKIDPRDQGTGRPPARLRFRCIFPTSQLWERMALMVQRNFSQIGVDVQFDALSLDEFNRRLLSGNFDAVLADLSAGNSAVRPYVFWYSNSKQNAAGYQNLQVDAAFDRLREAVDDGATKVAFHDLQVQMMDDPPGVFLTFGQLTRAVGRRFHAAVAPGGDVFRTIPEWRLAEQPVGRTSN
jgi:ABC-type transport system substrate-binding protein